MSRLVDRQPRLTAAELTARLVPPARFASVRFATFRPNPQHPSQAEARAAMEAFAASVGARSEQGRLRRWWQRAPSPDVGAHRPARYLDGGFGVGKTHLLAATWHEAAGPGRKAYCTFEELCALIGFAGMESTVETFSDHRLLCIDEFELDDVANTLMAVTFLRAVVARGVKVAATSNSLPDRLGEGRFNADDFEREIAAIADHFDVVRLDGPDYRATSRPFTTHALPPEDLRALAGRPGATVSVDGFADVLAHLRAVHPVHFGAMLAGLDAVVLHDLAPIDNQGSALLFVALVDELYDAQVTFAASGCDVDQLFPASYRHGGYRKKYGRAESRLAAMLAEATELLHA